MTDDSDNLALPPDGRVADAVDQNWVDRYAPGWSRPYLRLSRADRPAGTWLLLIPCWWGLGLAMAANGGGSLYAAWLAIACALGAFLMRGAGCTWNDLADQDFDAEVARTRSRPLPSGQVTRKQAYLWMLGQMAVAFAILLTFPLPAIGMGIVALIPVAIYPFAKRFTWWPQVFLGVAFNWGILLCWVALRGTLEWPAIALYGAAIAWTLFYDTIYAHQDKEDDALIGVKSTARLFGERTAGWLLLFQVATIILATLAVILALLTPQPIAMLIALVGVWAMGMHLNWQLRTLDTEDADRCLQLFRSNRDAGLILVAGLIGAGLFAGL
ncbi:4-hydroxybenzoate octaprenyltransferase [Pontivivens insulae]|uniref:4-hydroxybenzoate octaprenyltransferase n=1 Tax=Pontivivens insulae TaxID=1639689 RepID=A0A2R8A6C5_9RHOB|nr:4-hydroxybenzoate octaprenyltransferase [Pontivivens insulae]RED17903.1 4-hydroxybenzoate polyprenyltransferase [Pontivivens insulae]SPF27793.1 4-hydroxybenzoate octaprenyltransferase [Pontivivens insulae]